MKIIKINKLEEKELNFLLNLWEENVRVTHTFLNENDILKLKPIGKEALKQIQHLFIIKDDDIIKGFMGIKNDKIEMLFIEVDSRGNGYGKKLIEYAINNLNIKYVDVNEQNPKALGFYEYLGFEVFKRDECDDQGNDFPILHLKLKNK